MTPDTLDVEGLERLTEVLAERDRRFAPGSNQRSLVDPEDATISVREVDLRAAVATIKTQEARIAELEAGLWTLSHQFETGWCSGNDSPHEIIGKAASIARSLFSSPKPVVEP